VNNWIQSGLLTANIRKVSAVGGNSLSVLGSALTVTTNDRIFLIGNTQPSVSGGSATYTIPQSIIRQRDDDSSTLYTNSMVTSSTDGLVQFYASHGIYDCLVQDGNQSNQGSVVDLPVGAVEGVSTTFAAVFGATVTINGALGVTGTAVFGATVTVNANIVGTTISALAVRTSHEPVVNVRHPTFGATGNGTTDDTAAIQAAIDAAELIGPASRTGAVVYFPPGAYLISNPLVLPRTTVTPTTVVHLRGENIRSCRIVGAATFPTNRGMVEWDVVTQRAWHQSIKDLTFVLPSVLGTMAIYYLPTDVSTSEAMRTETLQIDLSNLLLEGANEYHTRLIYLRGNLKLCKISGIYGDCSVTNHAFDTRVIETDIDDFGNEGADGAGFFNSQLSDMVGNLRRGGRHQVLRCRALNTTFQNMFGDGCRSAPSFDFYDCIMCTFNNLATEGRGDQPVFRFTSCINNIVTNIGVATPNDDGAGIGNGIELISSTNNTFINRWARNGQQSFNQLGVKFLTLDSNSHRNTFRNFMLTTDNGIDPTLEFTNSGLDNEIEYYRVTGGVPGPQFHLLSSVQTPTVPSKAALELGQSTGRNTWHKMFFVGGTISITSISSGDTVTNREITLIFTDVLTVTDGNNLILAGNFVTTADDTLTLKCDGTNWYETSRSAN
jgi:hypothetical protein